MKNELLVEQELENTAAFPARETEPADEERTKETIERFRVLARQSNPRTNLASQV